MKKLGCMFLILCSLLLTSCSTNGYERDTREGTIKRLTLNEMCEKIELDESFAVSFTQEMCGYCLDYHKMLNTYLKNHNVTMYEVYLTAEDRSQSENLEIIHRYFPSFRATPGIYYVSKGEAMNSLTEEKREVTEKSFDEWVQKNKLDEKSEK